MPRYTQNIGIDTSVLIRLLTGHPEKLYAKSKAMMSGMLEKNPRVNFVASNQVIGEAYVALNFHFKIDKPEARQVLADFLSCGMVQPANGNRVIVCLRESGGCGLVDRLIADGYENEGMNVLTHDRKMGQLENAILLKG